MGWSSRIRVRPDPLLANPLARSVFERWSGRWLREAIRWALRAPVGSHSGPDQQAPVGPSGSGTRQLRSIVLATVSGWLAPAKDSLSSARPSGALRCGDLLCQFRLTNQGCQSILTGMDIEKLSVDVSSDDPAVGLRASLALHRLAERVEANHVASAREKGWSWQQIGDALGVTRQSVHTKYNRESS